jgi:hypothetical protein
MEPRLSSGDELEDHIGFGPVRYTSSELPARLARAQLSMRPCAPCVPPQHHDHDQDAQCTMRRPQRAQPSARRNLRKEMVTHRAAYGPRW